MYKTLYSNILCEYYWFQLNIHVILSLCMHNFIYSIYIVWILLIFSWIFMFIVLLMYGMNIINFPLNIHVCCFFPCMTLYIQYILYKYCWFPVEYSLFFIYILLIFSWISMLFVYLCTMPFNIYCMNIVDFQLNIHVYCLFMHNTIDSIYLYWILLIFSWISMLIVSLLFKTLYYIYIWYEYYWFSVKYHEYSTANQQYSYNIYWIIVHTKRQKTLFLYLCIYNVFYSIYIICILLMFMFLVSLYA